MEKLSKAYSKATRELDALVKETRQTHHDQVEKYEAAAEEASKWNRDVSEFDYQVKAAQANARANFNNVKSETFRVVSGAWDDFERKAAAIRAELAASVSEADTMRAADIDQGALALLGSGLMRAKDYAQMAKDYGENAAILALLRQSATKYADGLTAIDGGRGNAEEIYAVRRIVENAKTSGAEELQAFDNLLTSATTLAGRTIGGFRQTMQLYQKTGLDRWEELAGDLIGGSDEADDE